MKLKLGKMTSKEIASWLGITYNTYRNKIDCYLQKLEDYALFEKVYGGIIIKEIYIETYDKHLNKKTDAVFLKEVASANDQLSTISGISRKYKKDFDNLSQKTIKRVFTESRNRLFGKECDENLIACGRAGKRQHTWAIKLGDYNQYRLLTAAEDDMLNTIINAVYRDLPEDKIKLSALIDYIYAHNDNMTKDEFIELKKINGCNFFFNVIERFKELTGYQLVHANRYELGRNFDLPKDEAAYIDILFAELDKDEAE